jgi:hypothetical protein
VIENERPKRSNYVYLQSQDKVVLEFIGKHLLLDMAKETLDAVERYFGAVMEEVVKVITENMTSQKTVSGLR